MGKRYITPVPIPFPLLPHAHADGLYSYQLSLPLAGFSPGHLGVRAPYALHYEPYALILALCFICVALRVVRVWYMCKKSAYACVIHSTTCNAQLQCSTEWFSNWKASLLCWASRGFPNRKLLGLINF